MIKNSTGKLKAAALLNSVTTCLIVALFSSAIIMLWYYNRVLVDTYNQEIELIAENQYAAQFFQASYGYNADQNISEYKEVFENGIRSTYQLKPWGVYNVLTVTSHSKRDSISKSFLLGNTKKKNPKLGLYLVDNGKSLKYAGSTTLSENIAIPNANLSSHFIPKKRNMLKRPNKIIASTDKMPEIIIQEGPYDTNNDNTQLLEEIISQGGVLVNSFQNKTIEVFVHTSEPIEDVVLKGNIILTSKNEVVFGETAHIQDIIIRAPDVRFLKNFEGNVQVIATDNITLEDGAVLKYPSSIYTDVKEDSITIALEGKSRLYGSLVMNSNSIIFGKKGHIYIDTDAAIMGDVFCYGVVDLRGRIYGSAYINSFQHKTKTTNNDNLIVDAQIISDSIPKNYMRLPLIEDKEFIYHDIIKEL
ncbi:hypothetical protein [Dokdonia sp.]|uniref:hypothetical protein n=1 Tax=Dokdonia sp. TaxID=2024995 RepID=UPI00326580C7